MKNEDFIEMLKRQEASGMRITRSWTDMWDTALKYFFSEQIGDRKVYENWDWVVINYIWPSAIQEVAKLSKNRVKAIVLPWRDADAEYARTWEAVLQWLWEAGINGTGMRLEHIAAMFDCQLYGYRVSKVFWQNKARWDNGWTGDVQYKLWDPRNFWALGREKITDGACGTCRYVELDWAQRKWPDFKKALEEKAEYMKLETGNKPVRGQTSTTGSGGTSTGTGGVDSGPSDNPSPLYDRIRGEIFDEDKQYVKLSEQYFYDYEEEHVVDERDVPRSELGLSEDELNQIPPDQWPKTRSEYDIPKYPYGRYVVRVDDLILNPEKGKQRYPYTKWPFIVSPHYLLPHMWQGIDGVQLYKSTQDMINETVSHMVNNMKQFGDPKIAVESGTIATPPGRNKAHYKIGKGAGRIIRLLKGRMAGFKVIDPPQPSPIHGLLYQLFTQEFKNIMGLQSIGRGEKQPGKMTATEATHLVMSSNDRIALQSVYEDVWVENVLALTAEIVQKNYDIGRIVRIVGPNRQRGVTEINEGLKKVQFDVNIEPGTTLPFDEEKKLTKIMTAFKIMGEPIPNPMLPEALEALGISNWQELVKRHELWIKFVQFIQTLEGVKNGNVDPNEAIKGVVNEVNKYMEG